MALFKRKREILHIQSEQNKKPKLSEEQDVVFEDDLNDGYDDDLMGDEEDRRRLQQLPELERERILLERFENRQQIQRRIQRLREEGRLRESKKNVPSVESPLKKRKKTIVEDESFSLDEEEDEDHNDTYTEPLPKPQRKSTAKSTKTSRTTKPSTFIPPKSSFIPSLQQLVHITISSTALENWCNEPYFQKLVAKCFVRLNVGNEQTTNTPVYRLVQIIDLEPCTPYPLGSHMCHHRMIIRLGDYTHTTTIDKVSNQPVTPEEFSFFVNQTQQARDARFPTLEEIQDKARELSLTSATYVYTDSDITQMIHQKKMQKKYSLDDDLSVLMRAASDINLELSEFEEGELTKEQKEDMLKSLEHINQLIQRKRSILEENGVLPSSRNEKKQKSMREPTFLVQPKQSSLSKQQKMTYDPFDRIKTQTSSFFADSTKSINSRQVGGSAKQQSAAPKEEAQMATVDQLAEAHNDIDIDIEL